MLPGFCCCWGLIALQCCLGFCLTTVWISCMYTYITFLCSLPLRHPPPPGHHRAPSWAPHVIWQLPSSHLVYMWQCMSVSAILPICPPLPIPPCPMSILYSCISIPALQISSSLPFFLDATYMASLVAQLVKNPPAVWETWVRSLSWEDPLEKGKATHSSILAWRIPWTVESVGLQRVGHNWATFTFTCMNKFQL